MYCNQHSFPASVSMVVFLSINELDMFILLLLLSPSCIPLSRSSSRPLRAIQSARNLAMVRLLPNGTVSSRTLSQAITSPSIMTSNPVRTARRMAGPNTGLYSSLYQIPRRVCILTIPSRLTCTRNRSPSNFGSTLKVGCRNAKLFGGTLGY